MGGFSFLTPSLSPSSLQTPAIFTYICASEAQVCTFSPTSLGIGGSRSPYGGYYLQGEVGKRSTVVFANWLGTHKAQKMLVRSQGDWRHQLDVSESCCALLMCIRSEEFILYTKKKVYNKHVLYLDWKVSIWDAKHNNVGLLKKTKEASVWRKVLHVFLCSFPSAEAFLSVWKWRQEV